MAFGYALLIIAMSEVFPVTAPLVLTVAFFVPFMDRRSFLFIVFLQSLASATSLFVQRDLLRGLLFGVDIFEADAALLICLLTGSVQAPPWILCMLGFTIVLAAAFTLIITLNMTIVKILWLTGFYRRIGKTCPREWWSMWREKP